MNVELERLIALQMQDMEARRLRDELADAPKRVAAAEAALQHAEVALAAAETALKKEEVLRHGQEVDVAEKRTKIGRLQKQMETASSAQQITALEHEIEFTEQQIAKLEDDEMASMERTEQQESARKTGVVTLDAAQVALKGERDRAAKVKTTNNDLLQNAELKRAQLREAIADNWLAHYDRIMKSRGTGVSEGVDHKCSACQMMVRPQKWNDLTDRAAEAILSCESCGRLLYFDPRRDTPTEWEPGKITSKAMETGTAVPE